MQKKIEGIVVNPALRFLHGGSLDITFTSSFKKSRLVDDVQPLLLWASSSKRKVLEPLLRGSTMSRY